MKKIFTVAMLRDLEQQVTRGDISFSRMVEILNETAHAEHIKIPEVKKCDPGNHKPGLINHRTGTTVCLKCGQELTQIIF